MTDDRSFVIVGAGHAGGRAAQALRAAGFAGRVILVGDETYPPYERPPLSKQLLMGDEGLEKAQLHPPAYYPEHDIELRLGARAEGLDPKAHRLHLASGEALAYDKLMLTTGARVRRLDLPGVDLPGVMYLRDYDDTQAIREVLRRKAPTVVVGGGFIGLEVAASARTRGCGVTVIELADRLMGRAVAPEIGAWYAELHRRHGVDLRLGAGLEAFAGEGRLERVILTGGEEIPADLAVIGIGIVPNVELVAEAGLEINNGVVVDATGRTSDADIYAAGDVANQPNALAGRRLRLESYQNAQDQAMAVARNMCAPPGEAKPYDDRLWVWTDQYDVNLQMLGAPESWDRLVFRGDPASGSFTVFYMAGPRIVAVNTVNNGKEMRICERLMTSGLAVEDARLADPETKLRALLKG